MVAVTLSERCLCAKWLIKLMFALQPFSHDIIQRNSKKSEEIKNAWRPQTRDAAEAAHAPLQVWPRLHPVRPTGPAHPSGPKGPEKWTGSRRQRGEHLTTASRIASLGSVQIGLYSAFSNRVLERLGYGVRPTCNCHSRDCLKYRKSGGGWSLRTGISMPSPPTK
jgi:hypothetical protein